MLVYCSVVFAHALRCLLCTVSRTNFCPLLQIMIHESRKVNRELNSRTHEWECQCDFVIHCLEMSLVFCSNIQLTFIRPRGGRLTFRIYCSDLVQQSARCVATHSFPELVMCAIEQTVVLIWINWINALPLRQNNFELLINKTF